MAPPFNLIVKKLLSNALQHRWKICYPMRPLLPERSDSSSQSYLILRLEVGIQSQRPLVGLYLIVFNKMLSLARPVVKLSALLGSLSVLPSLSNAFSNPVIWEDLAELDIRHVGSTYSSSTMHYSPGAPILRSYDLFNWECIGHSVPTLDFCNAYSLVGGQACGFNLISKYVSYIYNDAVWVAQLSSDAKSEVKSQQVYSPPSNIGYLKGSRFYKRNGTYYILFTHLANEEWVIKSSSPFGSSSIKALVQSVAPPVSGAGYPHQGGLVDTPNGQWYYMAFIDAYLGGRIPVLAPVTWGFDGFPAVTVNPATAHPVAPLTGADFFTSIGPEWEWNHNPDTSKFSTGSSGLVLNTVTVTYDLYAARNTITHRILGPTPTTTIKLNYANMKDGDRAGLAMLRDSSAWVGVKRDNGSFTVGYTDITMNSDWSISATGTTTASAPISGGTILLRVTADIKTGSGKQTKFYYSTNGSTFTSGIPWDRRFTMNNAWQFFMGYRFAIFNYATSSLGVYVTVPLFQLDSGSGTTPSSVPNGATSTTSKATTTTTTTKTGTTTTTASGGGCTAAHYGQCGGSESPTLVKTESADTQP
ncbi:hypothetical protein FRC00_001905 [Tulasnella sp. 408]|nr:hypothetical protein FRC00_001905 [Tulasnella sp. 408]